MERSRFLSETLKYSGYYVIPSPHSTKLLQAHALNGSSSGIDSGGGGGAVQAQIYTPVFERYSDRYRKILGKKNFYNEIVRGTHTTTGASDGCCGALLRRQRAAAI